MTSDDLDCDTIIGKHLLVFIYLKQPKVLFTL